MGTAPCCSLLISLCTHLPLKVHWVSKVCVACSKKAVGESGLTGFEAVVDACFEESKHAPTTASNAAKAGLSNSLSGSCQGNVSPGVAHLG